jgi:hypothetical protein
MRNTGSLGRVETQELRTAAPLAGLRSLDPLFRFLEANAEDGHLLQQTIQERPDHYLLGRE